MDAEHDAASAEIDAKELEYQNRQYSRWLGQRFFETEGFRHLLSWNLAAFERAVHPHTGMHLLSLGCGLGDYELALAPRVAHITGVDFSGPAIGHARERAAAAGLSNVTFIEAAFRDLVLPPQRFDVVYAMGVLHHMPVADARIQLLAAAHGWLKPGGLLYVREPSRRGLVPRLAYRFVRRHTDLHSPNEEHLDPAGIAREVKQAGFSQVAVDYTDVVGGPMPWLVRSSAGWFWQLVFSLDRAWLAVPGLRRLASQFVVTGVR